MQHVPKQVAACNVANTVTAGVLTRFLFWEALTTVDLQALLQMLRSAKEASNQNAGLNAKSASVRGDIEPSPVAGNGPAVVKRRENFRWWGTSRALAAVATTMLQLLHIAASSGPQAFFICISA